MPDPIQIETVLGAGAAPSPASASARTLGGVALKAADYLVEDMHIKAPAVLAALVMGYGYLIAPDQIGQCKEFTAWLLTFATGAAVGLKRSQFAP